MTTNTASEHNIDISIVGGGMVGAAIALALSQAGMRVALIENGNEIDLTAFPQGIYVAVIRSGDSVVTRKLVKE